MSWPVSSEVPGFHWDYTEDDVKVKQEPRTEESSTKVLAQTCGSARSPNQQRFRRDFNDQAYKEKDLYLGPDKKPNHSLKVCSETTAGGSVQSDQPDESPTATAKPYASVETLLDIKMRNTAKELARSTSNTMKAP